MLFLTSSPINDNRCYLFLWFTSYVFLYKQLKKKNIREDPKIWGTSPTLPITKAIQVSYQPPWHQHLQGSNFPRAVHLPGPHRNTPISARCRRFQSCIRSLLWDPWTVSDWICVASNESKWIKNLNTFRSFNLIWSPAEWSLICRF